MPHLIGLSGKYINDGEVVLGQNHALVKALLFVAAVVLVKNEEHSFKSGPYFVDLVREASQPHLSDRPSARRR